MPLGAWSLWPLSDRKSMRVFFRSMGSLPTACTASVWNSAPRSWASAAVAAAGWSHRLAPIERYMREHCLAYFESVADFREFLLPSG